MRPPKAALLGAGALAVCTALLRRLSRGAASSADSQLRGLLRAGKKAVCVGKNYREHITELAQLGPEWKLEEEPEPVLFLKPTTSYAFPGEPLLLPRRRPTARHDEKHGAHHELELGVIIGERAKDVADEASAMRCVAGYVLGLDITERDEQTAAKNKGMPWAVSKGYDSFLPLSKPFTLAADTDWRTLRMWLDVNGERRQACDAGTMIHSVPSLICFISSIMTLEPGDLILTGTPAGVSRLVGGDRITAGVVGYVEMSVDVLTHPARRLDDPLISRCEHAGARSGPLAGLTFAAKDNLDVAGVATGNGSPDWARTTPLPSAHAPAVGALLDGGARLVGKAHMDELAFSIGGENYHYGSLENPRARLRSVGGSSSGSAVSVASGLVDVALGSDTTGSVRVPAAHCAVFGMRPTHGALSADGVCRLAPSYDTVGWLAQTAAQLAAVGDVLLPPPSASTPTSGNVLIADDALRRYAARDAAALEAAHAAVRRAAMDVAGAAGGSVRHVDVGARLLEACPTLAQHYGGAAADGLGALCALMREEQAGEIWASLGEWADGVDAHLGRKPQIGADVVPRLQWARETSTSDTYARGVGLRSRARDEVRACLDKLLGDGTLLCFVPVAAPPPVFGGAAEAGYRARTFELQGLSGVGGLPQLVLPTETVAVSFLAARGHDHRLLAMSLQVSG